MSTVSGRSFELVEIFEFGGEWGDHRTAAWVAVRYVTRRKCSTSLPQYSESPQLRIPFHSCLWRQFGSGWLGPSERSVPIVYEG